MSEECPYFIGRLSGNEVYQELKRQLEKNSQLQAVSGMNLDELIEKFVNGYVLVSPFEADAIGKSLALYSTNHTKLETL